MQQQLRVQPLPMLQKELRMVSWFWEASLQRSLARRYYYKREMPQLRVQHPVEDAVVVALEASSGAVDVVAEA